MAPGPDAIIVLHEPGAVLARAGGTVRGLAFAKRSRCPQTSPEPTDRVGAVVELERIPEAKALHRSEQRGIRGDADHADLAIREFWRRHRDNHESIVYLNHGTRADGCTGRGRNSSDGRH